MHQMEDLSHWDFAESFSGDEAAYLILGKNPNPSYQDSEVKKIAVVLHRLSNDYRAAGGALLGLLVKSEPCIELVLQGSLRSELMEAAFISAQRCKEWDAEMAEIEFDGWLASNDSRFVHQTFSRTELARWLKATGLKSKYQFERQEPKAAQPAPQEGQGLGDGSALLQAPEQFTEKPLGTRERDTLLTIIAALCQEAKLDYTKSAKTAGLILSAASSMGISIGETTIEGHLKKIPNALRTRIK